MLVPLTQSLYVPGELADTDHVLVDIGTGYFVEVRRTVRTVCVAAALTFRSCALLVRMQRHGQPDHVLSVACSRRPWIRAWTIARGKST